jgi:hypothetical protein
MPIEVSRFSITTKHRFLGISLRVAGGGTGVRSRGLSGSARSRHLCWELRGCQQGLDYL